MNPQSIEKYTTLSSPLHRLDARVKALGFILLIIISVSTPPIYYHAFLAYFAILIIAMFISRIPAGYYFARFLLIVPFVLLVSVSIPFMPHNGGGSISPGMVPLEISSAGILIFWNVMIKAIIGIMSLSIISATTPFPEFLNALEYFRVPRIFTLLAGFTYRYIFVLVEEILRMKRAGDSRLYGGRWIRHADVIGQMIGTLFLRSYERGERVYVAMVSRGFNGTWPSPVQRKMNPGDFVFLGAMIIVMATIRMGSIWITQMR